MERQLSLEEVTALSDAGVIDSVVEDVGQEVVQEAPKIEEEPKVEDVKSEEPKVAEVVVESSDDDIFVFEPEEEKVEEQKAEKVVKKIAVPFVNEKQKAIYNAIKNNPDIDIAEVGMLFSESYKKMPLDQLMKAEIASDPNNEGLTLTASNIEFLYNQKINSILSSLDPDNDPDYDEKKDLLLAREANRIKKSLDSKRTELLNQLNQEVEIDAEYDVEPLQTEDEIRLERENLVKKYSETFEPMLKSGVLKIKDKDGIINIPVSNKEKIAEAAADPVGFIKSLVSDNNGQINFQKFINVVNYGLNPAAYHSEFISYGISLGKGGLMKEIKNTKVVDSRPNDSGNQDRGIESLDDLKEAFASKFGRR